jgi:hypothetical protein
MPGFLELWSHRRWSFQHRCWKTSHQTRANSVVLTPVLENAPHTGADYSSAVPLKIFSNLNLHGATPPRVQPSVGEWGPVKVPTTKQKKRMRIWVSLALLGSLLAIFLLGWYVYYLMTGSWGFGIGDQRQLFQIFLLS